jgi:hypothetical protein
MFIATECPKCGRIQGHYSDKPEGEEKTKCSCGCMHDSLLKIADEEDEKQQLHDIAEKIKKAKTMNLCECIIAEPLSGKNLKLLLDIGFDVIHIKEKGYVIKL